MENRKIPNFAIASRPKRLEHFVGNQNTITQIVNLVCNSPHASTLALYGGSGLGKTSVSRYLGARLACLEVEDASGEPCGSCTVCQAIFSNKDVWSADPWPDAIYHEVDVSNLTNDERRDIVDYAPPPMLTGNRMWKSVVVLDEFQGAERKMQNKLLKDIEDCGDRISFIIVSSEPERLIPAIKTRCIQYRLGSPNESDLASFFHRLVEIAQQEFDPAFSYDPAVVTPFVRSHLDQAILHDYPLGYRSMAQNFTRWVAELRPDESRLTIENLIRAFGTLIKAA